MEDRKSRLKGLTPEEEAELIAQEPAGKALLAAIGKLPPDRVDDLITELSTISETEAGENTPLKRN